MSRLSSLILVLLLATVLLAGSLLARANLKPSSAGQVPEKLLLHPRYGTAEILSGNFKTATGVSRQEQAYQLFRDRQNDFHLAQPAQELSLVRETTDEIGKTHLRFQQTYQGLKVWGCQTIVHFNNDGTIYMVGGQTIPTPSLQTTPALDASTAQSSAITAVKKEYPSSVTFKASNELVIYPDNTPSRLAWFLTVTSPQRGDIRWRVFVDAQNGTIINKYNDVPSDNPDVGTGIDVLGNLDTLDIYNFSGSYQLVDATRSMFTPPASNLNGVIVTYNNFYASGPISTDPNSDKVWNDNTSLRAEVSGHYYARLTYDYYLSTFGWNSFDNSGSSIIVNAHDPVYTNNAYWNGQAINFADGDGVNFLPFSGSLDVVAHELTHGVTEHTAALIYQNQSGALNESMSDVFGSNVDRDDWLLGEDIRLTGSGIIRSMQDPNITGQPKHMNDYRNVSYDNGGVHVNSGIPNHAYYQAATLLGRSVAEQIWFRTLRFYLTPASDFYFWAGMTMQSAYDLYGNPSTEADGINTALDLVGLNTVYSVPFSVSAGATIGTQANESIWLHNPGPGAKTVTAVTPTFPGLTLGPGPGHQATIPEGASSEFLVTLDATSMTACDIASSLDTIRFDVTGSIQSQVKLPATIAVGYTAYQTLSQSFATTCLTTQEYNTSRLNLFSRDGVNALYDASLLIGVIDGSDTTAFRDIFGDMLMSPVDQFQSSSGQESFRIASPDGRVQGSVTYTYDPSGTDCEFIVADYEFYNPCDTPLTVLTGLYGDFDIINSGTNYADYDTANQMVYMYDQSNTRACGFALLNGTPRNLRAVNNPTYVWPGFTDGIAYTLMNNTGNLSGLSADDWSILLTFGSTSLGPGDTVRYQVALMYSNTGSSGLPAILDKTKPNPSCCQNTVGNADCDPDDITDIGDLTRVIDYLFFSNQPLCCVEEANVDGDVDVIVDIADVTALIDYLFINNTPLLPCQ